MGIKETLKNTRLKGWIENGEATPAEVVAEVAQTATKVFKPKRRDAEDGNDIAIIHNAQDTRATVGEAVKGGVLTGVGLTVCAAGLGRMLLAPSGIVGMGLAIGGGAVTVIFGGKTLKDYWKVNRKLKRND